MDRYSIVSNKLKVQETAILVKEHNGDNIRVMPKSGIVFANLLDNQVASLRELECVVKLIDKVHAAITRFPTTGNDPYNEQACGLVGLHAVVTPPAPVLGAPIYTPAEEGEASGVNTLKATTSPELSGRGITIAVMDTGIRATHELLVGRVVLSKNCVGGQTGDGFGHGTNVASVIVGIAPMVDLIDVKIINDTGIGTEEDVVEGVEYIIDLVDDEDPHAPKIVNMSIGSPDTAYDNIIRVAMRSLLGRGIVVVAAAGNNGPGADTITTPAVERNVLAVGSCDMNNFAVSSFSSRGPTSDEIIKPDCVLFGEDVIMAGNASDNHTVSKSGTSFSAPLVSGICALWAELFAVIQDAIDETNDPSRYNAPTLTPSTVIGNIIPNSCAKPEGVDTGKDNNYGYGILLAGLTAESYSTSSTSLTGTLGTGIGDIMPLMMTMMMMTMIMRMMTGMTTSTTSTAGAGASK